MATRKHGNKQESLINEEIQCKYCKKAYREPKLLPCLHIICKRCLKSILRKRGALFCPVCLTKAKLPSNGIDELLPGFTAKRKLYQIEQRNKVRKVEPCTGCENSSNKATSRCVNCDELLCQDCVKAHRRVKFTKDHTINLLADEKEKHKKEPETLFCTTHDKQILERFCRTCDAAICETCQQESHSSKENHDLASLAERIQEIKTSLKNTLVRTRENIAPLQKSVYETIKTFGSLQEKVDNVTWEIRKSSRRLIKAVKDREHELLKELRDFSDSEADKIVKEKDRVEATLMQVMDACDFTEDILEQEYDSDILAVKCLIELRLKSIREERTDVYLEDCMIVYEGDEESIVEAIQRGFGHVRFNNIPPASQDISTTQEKNDNFSSSLATTAPARGTAAAGSQEGGTEDAERETIQVEPNSEHESKDTSFISKDTISDTETNDGVDENLKFESFFKETQSTADQMKDITPSDTSNTEIADQLKGTRSLPAIPTSEEPGAETQTTRKKRLGFAAFLGRKPAKRVGKTNLVTFDIGTLDNHGRHHQLTVDVESPDGSIISAQVLDNKNGTYTVFYCPQAPGDYNMYVSLSGKGITRGRRVMNFYGCFKKMKSDEVALAGKALSLINWQATPGLLQVKKEKVMPNPKIHFEDVGFI